MVAPARCLFRGDHGRETERAGSNMPPADFVEHSQVEARLRESEERLRWLASIVESCDDAIISKTLDAIITSWNKGAVRMFGYTAEEAVGKPVTILIPPDRQHEERTILERIGRGERIEHYETIRRRKDGSLIAVSLTVSPIKDVEGRIIGASKIARDLTERKDAEARENTLMAELTHINRVATAGVLSASIAHEVNQPLLSIAVNAETVRLLLASEKPDIDEAPGDKFQVDINRVIRTVMGLVS